MFRDLVLIQSEMLEASEPENRSYVPAVLVARDGSVKVPGRPNYVWARYWNQPSAGDFMVYNPPGSGVAPVEGNLVKIGKIENRPQYDLQIMGLWDGIAGIPGYTEEVGGALGSAPHELSHRWVTDSNKGPDAVPIYDAALQIFKTIAIGGTSVIVMPLRYYLNGVPKEFPGGTYDLASHVPATAATKRRVLLYLNAATNTIQFTDGPLVADSDAVIATRPAVPLGGIGGSYVLLREGQTLIDQGDDVENWRGWLEVRGQQGSVPAPAEAGMILISGSGGSYSWGRPLVDSRGRIITDDDGNIVVE